ncbi:MAG: DUF4365 domain-containing protein [Acidobacteria bacterium]|nr:DUF4365 domain-containing protein [Acidobacteriota bacterium]
MAKGKSVPRKRRTREHVIADLAVNPAERRVLLCGHTMERRVYDYGIDLVMTTDDRTGEVENGEVLFQVKATNRPKRTADGQALLLRVARADLRAWLGEPMPVILVVYDAQAERAYWLYVQAEFEKQPNVVKAQGPQTMTVRLPRSQRFIPSAVRKFAQYKDQILAQQLRLVHHA